MEYYSEMKRLELLVHTAIWMNLNMLLLSERGWITPPQKDSTYMILFI